MPLVNLTMVGRKLVLVWNKRHLACRESDCPTGTWTEVDERIAAPRLKMTDFAGRWATFEVGKNGRTVVDVADHPDALEVDKEHVHSDRVSDHGGFSLCWLRHQADLQSPPFALVTTPRRSTH